LPNIDYLINENPSLMNTNLENNPSGNVVGLKKATPFAVIANLRHLAFDNSLQANIISTVSSGKFIIANIAACKLLGYTEKELLTKSRADIFDINEWGFKKMLKQRTAMGHSKALVTAIKKDGEPFFCEITSAVFKDEEGIEKAITTIVDMSQSILLQRNIDSQKEKIVADNIVLAKSEQEEVDLRKEKVVEANIVQARSEQKEIDTLKEKIVADNITRAKSNQKKIDTRKEKIVADNIILAAAKSDARLVENNEELSEIFLMAARLSVDVIMDWNILTNEMFIGDGFEELFGYAVTDNKGVLANWGDHIHPDDKEVVERGLQDTIISSATHWEHTYRFIRADGSIARVFGRASIIRQADGKASHMIGAIHDLSRLKELEEKLDFEIQLKEKQIVEATKEAKDTERSDIGKELHDNVNQLLGASRLYQDMAKKGGEDAEMYLSRSSEYTLTAIEEIRKLTKGLTTDSIKDLGLCEAIDKITRDMIQVTPVKISCSMESFIEQSMSNKFKLNVFRIVQEHLNNILKHARATEVNIHLLQNKKSITLAISDNGIGFNTCLERKEIGLTNIKSRAASFNGTADFASQSGEGCVLIVTFPLAGGLSNES
jgi:PAS domain S-box-containing protein